ncbi:MAG: thiamine phosphate synthase [Nitrospiraceae bacterium]|nr:thiamine phosphate synthase [Nitrospiraceae bacterium]
MYLGGLYLITDRKLSDLATKEIVSIALKSGIKCIQYREKEKSRRDIYNEALELRKFTEKFDVKLIINDHVDIASAVNADGVHLGQDDFPIKEARNILGKKKIIGISTHNIHQALKAEEYGADYIGFGPIFRTFTKEAGAPKGTESLREVKKLVRIPVIAIGGINLDNLMSVLDAGADAVAVASAILHGDITENIKSFLNLLYKK